MVYDKLSDEDKKIFDAARCKDIDNLLKLGFLNVMTPEDNDHFAKTTPENIIPTHVLYKSNPQDDGSVSAKSKSVLVDKKDPMIYQLERAAPTPTQEDIRVSPPAGQTPSKSSISNALIHIITTTAELAAYVSTRCDSPLFE